MQSTAVFLLYRYSGNGNRVIPNPGSVTDGDRYTLGGPLCFVALVYASTGSLEKPRTAWRTLKIARRPTSRAPGVKSRGQTRRIGLKRGVRFVLSFAAKNW